MIRSKGYSHIFTPKLTYFYFNWSYYATVCRFWRLHTVYLKFVFSISDSWSVFEPTSFFLRGNFYVVTLKCSFNLGNCDFTVMSDPNEIFFVAKTTDLTLSNFKPLMTNFNLQSSKQFSFPHFRVPRPLWMWLFPPNYH